MPRPTSSANALIGRNSAAQCTALGEPANITPSPEGAEQGELPEGWARLTVAEVASNSCASRAMEIASRAEIPFIPMALLPQDGSVTTQWELRKPEAVRSGVPFTDGDVLLAKITPCLENGKLGIAREVPGGWGMTSTEVYPLRPVKVTAEFLAAFLTQPAIRHALASKMQGATGRQRLPKEALDSFPIIAPPLPEQRAIADVLRTVQRAREATEKVIAATRQRKASLMKHLFTYGPVPVDHADRVSLRETAMGIVPEHWSLTSLGDLCAQKDGTIQTGPFGSQLHKSDYVHSGVPVVNPTHLLGNRINHADVPFITKSKAAELSRHRLRPGDVLFARRGEIGRHGFVTHAEDGWHCGTGCFLVRVNHPGILNAFLPWYFSRRQVVEWLESNAAGTIMPNLNNATLARLPVLYPALPEQHEIAAQLSAVAAKLPAEERRREALDALFRSLLHHLMTGKVRLPEFAEGRA